MRLDQYEIVLETKLFAQIKSWFGRRGDYNTFMQNGPPRHTIKSVKEFIVKQNIGLNSIQRLERTSNGASEGKYYRKGSVKNT